MHGIAAGLHALVHLPARYGPESRFRAAADRAGVAVRTPAQYTAAGERIDDDGVRLVLG